MFCEFLNGFPDRSAIVRTDLGYHDEKGNTHVFQAQMNGEIVKSLSKKEGHGWQPLFIPKGYTVPFSDLSLDEKTKISTRYDVVHQLITELDRQSGTTSSGLSIEHRRRLRSQIDAYFNFEEIKSLCFNLNIDKDEIMPPGTKKGQAIMTLIEHCSHRQMIDDLKSICREERPNVVW